MNWKINPDANSIPSLNVGDGPPSGATRGAGGGTPDPVSTGARQRARLQTQANPRPGLASSGGATPPRGMAPPSADPKGPTVAFENAGAQRPSSDTRVLRRSNFWRRPTLGQTGVLVGIGMVPIVHDCFFHRKSVSECAVDAGISVAVGSVVRGGIGLAGAAVGAATAAATGAAIGAGATVGAGVAGAIAVVGATIYEVRNAGVEILGASEAWSEEETAVAAQEGLFSGEDDIALRAKQLEQRIDALAKARDDLWARIAGEAGSVDRSGLLTGKIKDEYNKLKSLGEKLEARFEAACPDLARDHDAIDRLQRVLVPVEGAKGPGDEIVAGFEKAATLDWPRNRPVLDQILARILPLAARGRETAEAARRYFDGVTDATEAIRVARQDMRSSVERMDQQVEAFERDAEKFDAILQGNGLNSEVSGLGARKKQFIVAAKRLYDIVPASLPADRRVHWRARFQSLRIRVEGIDVTGFPNLKSQLQRHINIGYRLYEQSWFAQNSITSRIDRPCRQVDIVSVSRQERVEAQLRVIAQRLQAVVDAYDGRRRKLVERQQRFDTLEQRGPKVVETLRRQIDLYQAEIVKRERVLGSGGQASDRQQIAAQIAEGRKLIEVRERRTEQIQERLRDLPKLRKRNDEERSFLAAHAVGIGALGDAIAELGRI